MGKARAHNRWVDARCHRRFQAVALVSLTCTFACALPAPDGEGDDNQGGKSDGLGNYRVDVQTRPWNQLYVEPNKAVSSEPEVVDAERGTDYWSESNYVHFLTDDRRIRLPAGYAIDILAEWGTQLSIELRPRPEAGEDPPWIPFAPEEYEHVTSARIDGRLANRAIHGCWMKTYGPRLGKFVFWADFHDAGYVVQGFDRDLSTAVEQGRDIEIRVAALPEDQSIRPYSADEEYTAEWRWSAADPNDDPQDRCWLYYADEE